MKITKSILKQLIREALEDPSIAGSRMSGEEVYRDEERYEEGEAEENEAIVQLESVITDLINIKKKLELAQSKENK
jgi:hypothetical protein